MKKRKLSKAEKDLLKAEHENEIEKEKQLNIIYSCAACVFWEKYKWRKKKIMNIFTTSMLAYDECGDYGAEKSMIQMYYEECGVELSLAGYDYSFKQFSYLNGERWNRKLLPIPQLTLMRIKQKPWIAPSILAGLCLALHRYEKYGFDRIQLFIGYVDEIRTELGDESIEPYVKRMKEVTGIDINELWNDRTVWNE